MKLFSTQKVVEKTSGKIGVVRTSYDAIKQAVVNFGEGWVKVIPYRRLRALNPTSRSVRCISDQYDNFVCGKIYTAEATDVEDGVPINFEVIDEDGFEFPTLPTIFEEVK